MRTHIVVVALILIVCVAAFGVALRNAFVWDDQIIIVDNPGVAKLGQPLRFFKPGYWKVVRANYRAMPHRGYRPVPELLFAVERAVWHLNPAGFHATSLAVHAANCILLYVLACRLLRDTRAAAFAGLLFAAHPVHSEAVVWAKARPELLALLFVLAAILLYDRFLHVPLRPLRGAFYVLGIAAFGVAMVCKASAIVAPALLVVWVRCCTPPSMWRQGIFGLLPLAGVGAAFFAIDATLPEIPRALLAGGPFRTLTAVSALGLYLRLLVVPTGLCAHHRVHTVVSVLDPMVLRAIPFGLAVLAAVVVAWRRSQAACVALAWLIIGLLPASALRLMGRQVGELREYLPSVGFCLLLGLILAWIPRAAVRFVERGIAERAGLALCAVLVIAYAALSAVRTMDWRTEYALWTDTVAKNPDSWYARSGLAGIYLESGRPEEAIPHLEHLLGLDPTDRLSGYQLAGAYLTTEQLDKATAVYRQLALQDPNDGRAFAALGGLYAEAGRDDLARRNFRDAVRASPRSAYAHRQLGSFYTRRGRYPEALQELQTALRLKPKSPATYHWLGMTYAAMGRHEEALEAYRACLKLDPSRAPVWEAMGECYEGMGNRMEAERCYAKFRQIVALLGEDAAQPQDGVAPHEAE